MYGNRLGKWLGLLGVISGIAVMCMASGAHADDVLKLRTMASGSRMYAYWRFSNASRTIQSGDYIEYDVCISNNRAGLGGIEIYNTDGTYWRDQSGWADQNGYGGHPSANLSPVAFAKWYHRKLAVPTSMVGKTIEHWDVAADISNGYYYEIDSAMYNNIWVTHNNSMVLSAYADGSPSLNTQDFVTGLVSGSLLYGPDNWKPTKSQVATYLFYGLDCPWNNNPSQQLYHSHGETSTWTGYGSIGYYSPQNTDWWEAELQDMKLAGVDIALLQCQGYNPEIPDSWFDALTDHLVPALDRSGCGVKIALFDDTCTEVRDYNYCNGRGWSSTPSMPLTDTSTWWYFYDRKIKPFYQSIPQKYWATHNGLSLEQGGRPIITTWGDQWYTGVSTTATTMWQAIKDAFARDFKDANGNGIVPYLIHDKDWYDGGGTGHSCADSYTKWGAAYTGPTIYGANNYYVSEVGPGFDERLIVYPNGRVQDRGYGQWMIDCYNSTVNGRRLWDSNLIIEETWNEIWESTCIGRIVDYPAYGGGYMSETTYIDEFRNLIRSSLGLNNYDATFLQTWTIPTTVTRGSTQVTTSVRNDGQLQWPDTTNIKIGAWLENVNTGAMISGSEVRLGNIPSAIVPAQQFSRTWTVPSTWPTGTYNLRMDMVWDYSFWFNWQGDTMVKKQITIN